MSIKSSVLTKNVKYNDKDGVMNISEVGIF